MKDPLPLLSPLLVPPMYYCTRPVTPLYLRKAEIPLDFQILHVIFQDGMIKAGS